VGWEVRRGVICSRSPCVLRDLFCCCSARHPLSSLLPFSLRYSLWLCGTCACGVLCCVVVVVVVVVLM
jgi:hypothetical protein